MKIIEILLFEIQIWCNNFYDVFLISNQLKALLPNKSIN